MTSREPIPSPISDDADLQTATQVRDTSGPLPMEGAEVVTADGDRLGKVAEVRGDHFKVDAPMSPDYWLPVINVASTTGGVVNVTFAKVALDDYKIDLANEPQAARLQAAGPATPDELDQRLTMLQQLEQQRAELREGDALPDAAKTIGEPVEVELDVIGASDEQNRRPEES